MKRFLSLLAAWLVAAPFLASAQEQPPQSTPQEDPVDRILRRVEGTIDEDLQRLRTELRALIRHELGVEESGSGEQQIQRAIDAVTPDFLRETLTWLSSDERHGRRAGSEDERAATEYIARDFAEYGLEPVGDRDDAGNATYFQHFSIGRNQSLNCVGLLRGSDDTLADQVVVIGGHHDHLGQGRSWGALGGPTPDDDIYNGADDNGSGSTTVVSIARAFHEAGLRPRRSILFMTFGAEELGLVGSRHYCQHPIFPLADTVAMINMDMVGRNAGRPVGLYGVGTADIFHEVADSAVQATGLNARLVEGTSIGFGDSDHSSFVDAGVPAMFFFTGLHGQYHRVTDHVDLIEFDNMALIGKTALLMLWDLATRDARPQATQAQEAPPAQARALGIQPNELAAEEMDRFGLAADAGAVEIRTVSGGSVAERIGLQANDWIVSFNGTALPREEPLAALREAIQSVETNTDVPLEILREGRRLRLTARWDE